MRWRDRDPREGTRATIAPAVPLVLAAIAIGVLAIGALAVGTLGLLTVAAAPVDAGDNVAIMDPTPQEVDVDPGEEFTVEVVMTSDGGYDDVGVQSVAFRALYHPEYVEIVDVARGPWMDQGEETEVETDAGIAHDEGVARMEQERNPPAGGAVGNEVLVTFTVEVAEDAPPSETTIGFDESEVRLTDRMPQPVHDRNVTVSIDGGGDRAGHESVDRDDFDELEYESPDGDSENGTDDGGGAGGSSGGDDASGDGEGEDAFDSDDEGESNDGGSEVDDGTDAVPGFTVALAVIVLAAFVATTVRSRRR